MICLLQVVEGPAVGRRCWLRDDQRLSIGRMSTSDFAVTEDLHMSRVHLLVEGVSPVFRVRDAGSRNGTWVNQHRVSNMELCDGDTIRAGVSTFLVRLQNNPDQELPGQPEEDPLRWETGRRELPSDTENTVAGLPFIPVRTVTALYPEPEIRPRPKQGHSDPDC